MNKSVIKKVREIVNKTIKEKLLLRYRYKFLDTNKYINDVLNIINSNSIKKEDDLYSLLLNLIEHVTVYLHTDFTINGMNISMKYKNIEGSVVGCHDMLVGMGENVPAILISGYYITTNLKVLLDNDWEDDLRYVDLSSDHRYFDRRITTKISPIDDELQEILLNLGFTVSTIDNKFMIVTGYVPKYLEFFNNSNKKYQSLIDSLKSEFSRKGYL